MLNDFLCRVRMICYPLIIIIPQDSLHFCVFSDRLYFQHPSTPLDKPTSNDPKDSSYTLYSPYSPDCESGVDRRYYLFLI